MDEMLNKISNLSIMEKLIEPPDDIEAAYSVEKISDNINVIHFEITSDPSANRVWTRINFYIEYNNQTDDVLEVIKNTWNGIMEQYSK